MIRRTVAVLAGAILAVVLGMWASLQGPFGLPDPAPQPSSYTCTEDMSCRDGGAADARTNPGIGAERWQHVDWTDDTTKSE